MPSKLSSPPDPAGLHGRLLLPTLRIDSYSVELRDEDGQVGDRASQTAFRAMLDAWRSAFAQAGKDPLGTRPTHAINQDQLDRLHAQDNAAGEAIGAAMEEYAQQLAHVVRAFRQLPAWRDVQRIVVGGGFQQSEVGTRAVERTAEILASTGQAIPLATLHQHADEGALLGWVPLVPAAAVEGYDAMLAVDIGGTNVRCGLVRLPHGTVAGAAEVLHREKWHHAADGVTREDFVHGLSGMLVNGAGRAMREQLKLAPLVGIACPGVIAPDGRILRGAQNLPGDWEGDFHLADAVAARLKEQGALADGPPLQVLLHNDAVVQGLGELAFMQDVERWGVLTAGTGLGNAAFTNLRAR